MCDIENLELIKKYICDEIMCFKPIPTHGDYLHQLEIHINNLVSDDLQSIFCLYSRVCCLKQKTYEYERALNELMEKIPNIKI